MGDSPADLFAKAALSDRPAEALPHLPGAADTIWSAAAAGDDRAVAAFLRRNPALARRAGGPRNFPPLLYAAFSRFHRVQPRRRLGFIRVVRLLLKAGADPDTSWRHPEWPDSPQTALYGATGETDQPGIARVLLEAGADPDDGESIYHAAEHFHLACLTLLKKHGADLSGPFQPWNNTPLYFLMGYPESHPTTRTSGRGVRWLLENGADPDVRSGPDAETPLHRAVRHGRSPATLRLLLRHGADPDARTRSGQTPLGLAVALGDDRAADLLRRNGASESLLRPEDVLLGACARGALATARRMIRATPGLLRRAVRSQPDFLAFCAGEGRLAAVRTLLAAGFPPHSRGEAGGTALHLAAWNGHAAVVRLLVRHGASLSDRRNAYKGSPLQWAVHGAVNAPGKNADHAAVVRALLQAGARVDVSDWGSASVQAVARRHGVLAGPM